ncbi:ABC transporter substrate-binding protein [Bacillus sp. JJ722]|uniref:ABC transporter substrate-binding protein n=1 Tax=Bacillus sp. JJ722 TaxID=3122973 RepID=UPI003000CEB4
MKVHTKTFLMLIVLALFIIAGCSKATSNESGTQNSTIDVSKGSDKIITIGITNPPGAFNPIVRGDYTAWYVSSLLYSPFIELDSSFEFVPKLAKSIESEDNQTFTVTLQENAVWTDGKPVTAEDVVFTAKLIGSPDSNAVYQGATLLEGFDMKGKLQDPNGEIPGIKLINEHTIEFKTKTPMEKNLFYDKVASHFKTIPKHIFEEVPPAEFAQHPAIQEPKVTNGPFTFGKYATNQYIELKANETYFLGKPKLDKLFFKIMPSANIVAQLQNGEIDMNFPGIGTISNQDFERVENLSNVKTTFGNPIDYQILGFNYETIEDVNVRQAIAHAINRKMIVESLLKGKGEINDLIYSSANPYYNEDIETVKYDINEAKKLLDAAEWDSSKVLRFVVPSGNGIREKMADLIVQNLADAGIKVKIEKYDLATALQKTKTGEYDLFVFSFPFSLDPDISTLYHSQGANNIFNYTNSKLDQLLGRGLAEVNPENRKLIYNEIQELLSKEMPSLVLVYETRMQAVSKRVKVGQPAGIGALVNVHEWDVEE